MTEDEYYFDETEPIPSDEIVKATETKSKSTPAKSGEALLSDDEPEGGYLDETASLEEIDENLLQEQAPSAASEEDAYEEDTYLGDAFYEKPASDYFEEPDEWDDDDGYRRTEREHHISVMDVAVVLAGIAVFVAVVVFGSSYLSGKAKTAQQQDYAEAGSAIYGVSILGEEGISAVYAQASNAEGTTEEASDEATTASEGDIKVDLFLSSILKDIKIKFLNDETSTLITGVPFRVKITDSKGKTAEYTNKDMDGIIYATDLAAGDYKVEMLPMKDEKYASYQIAKDVQTINVKDKIVYEKVDVSDEIKKESEVNVAKEDTARHDATVESANTDTVGFVDSTVTKIDGATTQAPATPAAPVANEKDSEYEEVNKNDIPNPNQVSKLMISGDFHRMSATLSAGTASSEAAAQTVAPAAAATMTVAPTEATIVVGKTIKLEPTLTGTTDYTILWATSDPQVATVAMDGTVTANAAGSCTVTATSGAVQSVSASCKVTVQADPNAQASTSAANPNAPLKDKAGNVLYVKNADGTYREATVADYSTASHFYKRKPTAQTTEQPATQQPATTEAPATAATTAAPVAEPEYKYTGWQTISGKMYYYDQNGNPVTGNQVIQGVPYTFDADGVLTESPGVIGIDVSKWNGRIDWNAVRNSGVSYAIIRCGYRGSTEGALIEDSMFRTNISGAKAAGLKVGVYFFSQAINEVEAVEEASMALSLISGYSLNLPVFLDVEDSNGRGDLIDAGTRTNVIRAFCQTVVNSGYSAGIYANKTWFNEKMDVGSLSGYKIWLAQYAAAPTYTKSRYDLWQYTSKGTVGGISGSVDMNISYMGS